MLPSGYNDSVLPFAGMYLFITGAKTSNIRVKATIRSPWASVDQPHCLSFAYYLAGLHQTVGILLVRKIFENGTVVVSLLSA